jgi:hypothetical protein
MEARNKAIADAFARVVICAVYCDRWITDYDFVRIIAHEHDLASDDTITFDEVMLNKALKLDSRFSGAEDPDGCEAGTIFRNYYSPRVAGSIKRRKVFCYYIVKTRSLSKPSPGKKWSDDIKSWSFNLRKKCAIAEEANHDLAKMLVEATKNDRAKQAKKLHKPIASTAPTKRKPAATETACRTTVGTRRSTRSTRSVPLQELKQGDEELSTPSKTNKAFSSLVTASNNDQPAPASTLESGLAVAAMATDDASNKIAIFACIRFFVV